MAKTIQIEDKRLRIEYVPIEILKPNEYNPKQMTEKEAKDLENSIVKFGIVDPLIVNKAKGREGIIIGGHQRYKVYQKLKYQKVPIVYLNIPDLKKEKELCLRLSKNIGSWDFDLLANFDESLLENIGWDSDELDEVFGLEETDEFDEQKEFEKAIKNPRGVKTGDLYEMGDHKLLIGDCVKKENWQKLLGEERFDFIFTDPPYRLAYCRKRTRKVKTKEGFKKKRQREYLSVGETDKFGKTKGFGAKQNRRYQGVEMTGGVPEYDEWLSIANEFQNPKGANVMVFEKWSNIVDLWQAIEKYWAIQNMIIWHLPNRHQGWGRPYALFNKFDIVPLAGEGVLNEEYEKEFEDYLKDKGQKLLDTCEIGIYGKEDKAYWGRKRKSKWAKVTDHITWTAATGKSGGQSVIFGTKPIQILVPYIKILSPRNGIVMDCFGGSGSTLIACEIMKRKARLIEIAPIYGEVILARWERFTQKSAIKLN